MLDAGKSQYASGTASKLIIGLNESANRMAHSFTQAFRVPRSSFRGETKLKSGTWSPEERAGNLWEVNRAFTVKW